MDISVSSILALDISISSILAEIAGLGEDSCKDDQVASIMNTFHKSVRGNDNIT